MAKKQEIYVGLGKIAAKKIDIAQKHAKSNSPKAVTKAMEEVAREVLVRFKSKGISTVEPKGNNGRGYELAFMLDSLAPANREANSDYHCELTVVVGTWKKLKPRAKIKKRAAATPNRIMEGVEAVTEAATKDALTTIVNKLGPP